MPSMEECLDGLSHDSFQTDLGPRTVQHHVWSCSMHAVSQQDSHLIVNAQADNVHGPLDLSHG